MNIIFKNKDVSYFIDYHKDLYETITGKFYVVYFSLEGEKAFLCKNTHDFIDQLNEDCLSEMSFSCQWRSTWDIRLYFDDDEYFSDQLKNLHEAWEFFLPILKEKYKLAYPNNKYNE